MPDNPTTPETPTTAIPFTTLTGTWTASNGTGTITSGDRRGTISLRTTHSNTIIFTNVSDSGNTWRMERTNNRGKTTRTTITFTSSTTAQVERLEDRDSTMSFNYTLTKQQ
ncbi:MAG: hypothetical protein IJQ75_06050 [Synergistaceae bacterium]|nr:hypothetical protein [Synergistaceae bacterium]